MRVLRMMQLIEITASVRIQLLDRFGLPSFPSTFSIARWHHSTHLGIQQELQYLKRKSCSPIIPADLYTQQQSRELLMHTLKLLHFALFCYGIRCLKIGYIIILYNHISADPCRQQGERVREEITSNKCCAVRGGDRKGSHGTMLTACGKLVSRQFRKQRLARWAAGRGPDPSFTAMVFEACGTVLGPELTARKSKG